MKCHRFVLMLLLLDVLQLSTELEKHDKLNFVMVFSSSMPIL